MKQNRAVVVIAIILALLMGILLGRSDLRLPSILGEERSTRNTQVVEAVQTEEEVVLVSLGVQGIASDEVQRSIRGIEIPGTERIQFVQYSYRAKLGLDGSQVRIEQTGDKAYRITLPDFEFIGHDEAKFQTAVEKNGVLSWGTPQIDTAKVVENILSDEAKDEQVVEHRDLLREQAEDFYTGIVTAIEPDAEITYRHGSI
ncbi:hypothetical protein ACTQ49_02690 [Luteococcus sp. Sow4_B9]|uniref:hypothetical protein n=1 Tax=Luteococcus sp. Sow4_B9 TaxID=3438792 RepID=UPI003F96881D